MAERTGRCLVSFLDLLGFSARMMATWGTPDDVLPRLLRIKERVQSAPLYLVTGREDGTCSYAETMTISDSIVVESDATDADDMEFFEQVFAVVMTIGQVVAFAADKGFGIRGALECGPLYRSESETIGPAFIAAYTLEQRAGRARILLGPTLAGILAKAWGAQLSADGMLYTCSDGAIALQPPPVARTALEKIAAAAGDNVWRYSELLRVVPRWWNKGVRRPRSRRDFLNGARTATALMDGTLRDGPARGGGPP